jgi:hypothetical protein
MRSVMERILHPAHPWISFNIALFSAYTIFGILSFFLPAPLNNTAFISLHLGTLIVNVIVIFGLIKRMPFIHYLIAMISTFMIVHLLIFIFIPLGMSLAYIAPSRAFYALFINLTASLGGERFSSYSLVIFNCTMVLIHGINVYYFTRKKVAVLFSRRKASA